MSDTFDNADEERFIWSDDDVTIVPASEEDEDTNSDQS